QLSGRSEFNELFFEDVRVPLENVVGPVNGGWPIIRAALARERGTLWAFDFKVRLQNGSRALADLYRRCRTRGRADLAAFRPRVAQAWIEAEVFGAHTLRILPRLDAAADAPPEAALQKLFGSEIQQRTLELAMAIAGPYAQPGPDGPPLLARFPDKIRMARPDEEGAALVIEGRRYPNASGPGAGCHAKHGMCLDRGANPFTAAGVLRDADREGIDAMVFFPSAALGLPAFTDLAFAAEFARLYNRWLAGYCRQFPRRLFGVGLVPIEDVATSIRVMREARELGLVALMVPAVLRTRNLDHRDLEPFHAAAEALA